jgi:hypothetical protein
MLSAESAVLPLDVSQVDMVAVKKLRQYPKLLQKLDAWILCPDHGLLPHLHELAEVMKHVYKVPATMTLYRGFNQNGFQENMGIKGMPHVGQAVQFQTEDKPLSFSTDISIAQAFGGIVVSVLMDTRRTQYLHITDELSMLVGELRGLKNHETQKEVIILPPSDFTATVVQSKKSPFSWMGW